MSLRQSPFEMWCAYLNQESSFIEFIARPKGSCGFGLEVICPAEKYEDRREGEDIWRYMTRKTMGFTASAAVCLIIQLYIV